MKNRQQLRETLQDFFSNYLQNKDFELIDIEVEPSKRRKVLIRFLIDKSDGITLDECAKLNDKIADAIEQKNLLEQSYILEVASPGLDRPLKTKRDFERVKGEDITIVVKRSGEQDTKKTTGKLVDVKDNVITLKIRGRAKDFFINEIRKAKLKIDLKGTKKK
jgi:ribosome maturation factor RimP